MNDILRVLNLPAARTSDALHLNGVGIVQYAVGFAALIACLLLSLLLFSTWSKRRQSIFLVGSLVSALGGIVLAATSALYRTPWLYIAVITVIIADVIWHAARRSKSLGMLVIWKLTAIALCAVICGSVGGVAWYAHHKADADLSSRLSSGTTSIEQAKAKTLTEARALSNESTLLATLDTPATVISLRQDHGLDFAVVRTADGTTKATTTGAPAFTSYPLPGSAAVEQPVQGTAAIVAIQQLGADTLLVGTYLGDSELHKLNFWGITMTSDGVQATGTLPAQEISVASSADIRAAFSDNLPKRLIAETAQGRTYIGAASIGTGTPLLVATRDDAGELSRRKSGVFGAALAGLLVAALAALIRRKRPINELKGIVFGGVLLALAAAYTAWITSLAVATMGSAYSRISVDSAHPALTAHVYIQKSDVGAAIVLDTAGANVASATFNIAVPAGVTAADVTPNQAFCVVLTQRPQLSNGILSFSCATSDPASTTQLATAATITLRSGVSYANLSLSSGSAIARRGGGATETLPVR